MSQREISDIQKIKREEVKSKISAYYASLRELSDR